MRSVRAFLPWAAATAAVAAVLAAGILNPVRPASLTSDALGPESGEAVVDYLARAHEGLLDGGDTPRWALVSFSGGVDQAALDAVAERARISQVLFRVPIDRVQTPLVPVEVSGHPDARRNAVGDAVTRLMLQTAGTDRASQVAEVSAERISQGCACAIAAVVHGAPDDLVALESDPQVRAVEALPEDAVYGRFSVTPLLPEHTDTVVPGPDDGPI